PGPIELQACGRGDIDLQQYCAELVAGDYAGPVCLEVIGAGPQHDLAQVTTVAAESYGYLNACLRRLGARR
ncbi:MAG: sugar phosphate isomerase/epimerase family protein, partial [Clostridia bacterium]